MKASSRAVLGAGAILLILQGLGFDAWSGGGPAECNAARVKLFIDPNLAPREELMLLPDIGPALADALIEYRESKTPAQAFHDAKDLDHVRGVGPATTASLKPHLRFETATAVTSRGEAPAP